MNRGTFENWQLKKDTDNIYWVFADKKEASTNAINIEMLNELGEVIKQIKSDGQTKGVVFASGKKTGFIVGADINAFSQFKEQHQAAEFIALGQETFNKIESLSVPTVAMINGICVGGGLELALSCQYRVVLDAAQSRLGLPEVKLGIQPGWGGSARLPKLIGALNAIPIMLSGSLLSAKAAKKLNLVDFMVPLRQLKRTARAIILNPPKRKKPSIFNQIYCLGFVRKGVGRYLKKKTNEKVSETFYPAPFRMIDNWIKYGDHLPSILNAEKKSICDLILHATTKELLRLFFLQDRLKSLAHNTQNPITHVHVVGAGVMGANIAAWCAYTGLMVTLQDTDINKLGQAVKNANELYQKKLKTTPLINAAMDRLVLDTHGDGVCKADLIIEAIVEDLSAKQDLLADIEKKAKPSAIIASNTSSIRLNHLANALNTPSRLVGIHFFNPVAQMQLVEVVMADKTDEAIVNHAIAFVKKINKLPVPVRDCPGFLVNRILLPYLAEAFTLLDEGISPVVIDKAATLFGMPMGPIELADTIGLDICVSVANHILPDVKLPGHLLNLVKAGKLGRKTGEGFYPYKKNKPVKAQSSSTPSADVTDRLILAMVNESLAALRENIVADSDLLDAAMIFGTGFVPCKGGPLRYTQTQSPQKIKQRLQTLTSRYGKRFTPDVFLDTLLK